MYSKTIKIEEGQNLSDVLNELPANSIIFKTVPGLGATTLEILADRHSIIIEPFVPVIEGKCEKHKVECYGKYRPIQAIMDGESDEKILEYFNDVTIPYKKIMSTPESYWRIKEILEGMDMDFRSEYFMLIDECEKIIQSKHFRKNIDSPLNDFFLYENKAMVSATPILPSDERFKNFNLYKVDPQYVYKKKILIYGTNNVVEALINLIQKPQTEKIFIFTNCINTIAKVIHGADIADKSMVYSSENSFGTLKDYGIFNYSSSFNKKPFKQINFLTSRFFSAVDIELPEELPSVIMATNLFRTPHSVIDPLTEAIQISGRIRTLISSLTHISNFNKEISINTKEQLTKKYNDDIIAYKVVKEFLSTAESLNSRSVISEMLDREFALILNDDKTINSYKVDNLIEQKLVPSYYNSADVLNKAYESVEYFKASTVYKPFVNSDRRITLLENKTGKEKRIELIEQINAHYIKYGRFYMGNDWTSIFDARAKLLSEDPLISESYLYLGYEKIKSLDYSITRLKEALVRAKQQHIKTNFQMIDAVLAAFEIGKTYTSKEIKDKLQVIYNEYLHTTEKASATHIVRYFDVSQKRDILRFEKKVSGFKIKGYKKQASKDLATIINSK